MRNPLHKRFPRDLRDEIGKYLVIFLFLLGMISATSGFLVASGSMSAAYDESFEKYNIEDGNFELAAEAEPELLEELEREGKVKIYPNWYIEEETKEVESTLRIFKDRTEVDLICLMKGKMPEKENEIAIDRMYADNNDLAVGDRLTVGGKELEITGFVALSDYSALFSNAQDMMFDAMKFGVAVMTDEGMDDFGTDKLHYSYSWLYEKAPADDTEAKEMGEDFMKIFSGKAIVANFLPQYRNQAIRFTGDDIKGDNAAMTVFLYLVMVIISFIFAITTSNTVMKESMVIGTLRASGYSRGELLGHYMTMPMLVTLVAAIAGNILGYTWMKGFFADMYYGSYSLPTYVTLWNGDAFVKTTIIPMIILFLITLAVLWEKLSLSPLRFMRRDLSRRKKKKAFRLNTKIKIMTRFRLRIIFQNLPNYITIVIGIFFANAILLFGSMFGPLLDNFENDITGSMICERQYVLKMPVETENSQAEKYCAGSLKTLEGSLQSEEITVYGVEEDSRYLELEKQDEGIAVSNAYAEKHKLHVGDNITLKQTYGEREYSFEVSEIVYYPAALAIFMPRAEYNEIFDKDEEYFNGYFSNETLEDIDDRMIATVITKDDLTKTSRQLRISMGNMMVIFQVFGVVMFMMIIYLLAKIIIEKNAQSISMTKILGYNNSEINGLYVTVTSIVVLISIGVTIPLANYLMKTLCVVIFREYSGYLAYHASYSVFVEMLILGVAAYAVVAWILMRKVKKVPLAEALKNSE